jgi:hypothetical protein
MSVVFPIVCYSCGNTDSLSKVAVNTVCASCGSDDIDIYDGPIEHVARGNHRPDAVAPQGYSDAAYNQWQNDGAPQHGFAHPSPGASCPICGQIPSAHPNTTLNYNSKIAASPGTGWDKPMPDRLKGWDAYQGPTPGRNPMSDAKNDADNTSTCPACGGSGQDLRASGGGYNEIPCRTCHGTGVYTPPTAQPDTESLDAHTQGPESGGARWQTNKSGSIKLSKASCPECDVPSTHLVKDASEHAWWHCASCGPLADLDRHPGLDPYAPGDNFFPDRNMKQSKLFSRKTGKLFAITSSVKDKNPGLTIREALNLSRRALTQYPESE